ncbi:MAG: alginate export family protein, partial [Candidatus Omnitrophica bacterium]|nr:alginate export family protein [Candidatus Omnitrophota bacterium]
MSKFLVFCIIALTVLMVVPAYAEVQNVKVSGDLAARWLLRYTYDLDKNNVTGTGNAGQDLLITSAEVEIDADLTDNVATVVRLANQRQWGDNQGLANGITTQQFDVLVDLANVTLKELVYSPLTVTIGRQDLWFGKGFIVGAKLRDPSGTLASGGQEYTVINSFDAIRATLDFDPWKIDAVYALLQEGAVARNDDVWMLGANVGYKFDSYKGEAEGYYWRKYDRSKVAYIDSTTSAVCERNSIDVLGIRGSLEPIANASLSGEFAWQGGSYSTYHNESRKRNAFAMDLAGDYKFKDVKWTPVLALEYIYYSGESKNETSSLGQGNKWNAWDQFYRGKFDSAIREFQNVYYATSMREDNVTTQ